MKLDITVTEIAELINVIQQGPESLFEMIRSRVQQGVAEYLTEGGVWGRTRVMI